jgi:hypothetical protein
VIKTDLNIFEFEGYFLRFNALIGATRWVKRAKKIRQAIQGNTFLKEYLEVENALVFALEQFTRSTDRLGKIPATMLRNRNYFFALAFVTQTVSIVETIDEKSGRELVGRITGAITNSPEELRALQVELAMATHFVRSGLSISFPSATGSKICDLLVHGIGEKAIEVECKSVSSDKGQKIHRADLLDFYKVVQPILKKHIATAQPDLAVVISVTDRLPKAYNDKKLLAELVSARLNAGSLSLDGELADIEVSEIPALNFSTTKRGIHLDREYIDNITRTNNRPVLVIERPGRRAIVLVVKSKKDDTALEYIYDTLARGADHQLSGHGPGLIVAGLQHMDAKTLTGVSEIDSRIDSAPTRLRQVASNLMKGERREHVVGVSFISENQFGERMHGQTVGGGSAYHFENETSSFWRPEYKALFGPAVFLEK